MILEEGQPVINGADAQEKRLTLLRCANDKRQKALLRQGKIQLHSREEAFFVKEVKHHKGFPEGMAL